MPLCLRKRYVCRGEWSQAQAFVAFASNSVFLQSRVVPLLMTGALPSPNQHVHDISGAFNQVGTGAILAAEMRGRATSSWVQPAIRSMLQSNGPAAAILRDHGANACTDVTGFGLAGHLAEMLRAAPTRPPSEQTLSVPNGRGAEVRSGRPAV